MRNLLLIYLFNRVLTVKPSEEIETFKDLQVIIDHFNQYPLVTAKKLDYDLFKKSFNIIKHNQHLTEQGISKIIELKSSLNKGLSENLKESFTGFVSGDGSFNIKATKVRTGKIQLRFAVNLHIREQEVIKGLAKFFNFKDNSYIYSTDTSVAIQIVNTSDVLNIIIPFFDKYKIKGAKELDFTDFKKAAEIVKHKGHLTEDGLNQILVIKDNMNLKRK
ncbi:hypothetical protein HYALB_00008486 [Hymenoscyphus albidus]|uniref:Homing endonuclease LAGLIDADG domain-containing protein n=1 Tax=Hymenoscyphus albidus TaxID=595503 RepID=A0A9N9LQF7_9HELO|nr:hypothetical protein HYALB_00008486 [Hymenoscyphus albidus]